MQSSFNLIKGKNASVSGDKNIKTDYVEINNNVDGNFNLDGSPEEAMLKSYELLGSNIIKKARVNAEKIIVEAMSQARDVEKAAYEKGYAQGQANGYEDGSNEGYSKAIEAGRRETSEIIDKANMILANAANEYEEYKLEKKREIINLALEMAKVIAAKEFELSDSLLKLVEPIIEEAKGEENILIRCNGNYRDSLKAKVDFWKTLYAIQGEIFVLEDPLMDLGKAIVEKKTGKTVVGIDIGLGGIESVLKEYLSGGNDV